MLRRDMKRTTVTLPLQLVVDLLEATPAKNKTQAVILAIEERIRQKKLETLKRFAGRGRRREAGKTDP
jgi:hypothetical protein